MPLMSFSEAMLDNAEEMLSLLDDCKEEIDKYVVDGKFEVLDDIRTRLDKLMEQMDIAINYERYYYDVLKEYDIEDKARNELTKSFYANRVAQYMVNKASDLKERDERLLEGEIEVMRDVMTLSAYKWAGLKEFFYLCRWSGGWINTTLLDVEEAICEKGECYCTDNHEFVYTDIKELYELAKQQLDQWKEFKSDISSIPQF